MDSSPELSSPPRSISADVPSPATRPSRLSIDNNRGVADSNNPPNAATDAPVKKRPGCKKKEAVVKDETPKEKKTRKPRTPKDPNAPVQSRRRKTGSNVAAVDASEIKEEHASAASTSSHPPPAAANQTTPQPRQQQIDQYLPNHHSAQSHQPSQHDQQSQYHSVPQQSSYTSSSQASSRAHPQILHPQHQSPSQYSTSARVSEPLQHPSVTQYSAPAAATQPPRPASSGQHFDPIRSSNVEFSRPSHTASSIPPISPPTQVVHRASASPSIHSLIDPNPTVNNVSQSMKYTPQSNISVTSAPVSPQANSRSHFASAATEPPKATQVVPASNAMDIDSEKDNVVRKPAAMKKSDSTGATNSAAPTPPTKPARAKEQPLPTGSGLLSGTPFGPVASSNGTSNGDSPAGTNIWLTFPLQGQNNVTINFAREVEKKYGFAALHPKIAAQKERKRQMAAAGAALEKASGVASNDDMSLDLSEPDSNVEMGGVDGGDASGINEEGKPRKRRKKVEDYDKEDDFIDDTELAWERQALMAKDGFFVYSGPLLTEGAKPTIEKADGTVRRGRGRGRGGATRGDGTTGRGGGPGSRGGRGSRGGTTVRKPRVTKAERALMEQEKQEREKLAANIAAKSALSYPGTGVMQ
ncbi:HPC2-domain-containing protein [Pseudovirgaria hyperparasitica]|uniref:HPC2-domain-containing protein n=1 Tax=Pseudovirgaria hyperparasitica TaxID=470096 RepID=A0A6A6W5J7_9PEZI|nr:HPC2-domain-containing protein [Pseudovirgaria hyperparasitica]KAF2758152.1 HPC2-domain-containing protein [Pseudovirgaria hyperparasitica]